MALLAAGLLPPSLSAQPGMAGMIALPGYVVLDSGDTLVGEIKWMFRFVENNPVEIKFTDAAGNAVKYRAGQIRGFGNEMPFVEAEDAMPYFQGMQDYVSMPSLKKGEPVFMHRLLPGRLTVYRNPNSSVTTTGTTETRSRIDGIGFTWSSDEGLSIGPTYHTEQRVLDQKVRFSSYFVSKGDQPLIKVDKKSYPGQFEMLFGDCPAVAAELAKNPGLRDFKNFMILAEVYNQLCAWK